MIYFVYDPKRDAIKIGCAIDVNRRITALNIIHKTHLNVLGVMSGAIAQERELHRQFQNYRIRGEWFRNHAVIYRYILEHAMIGEAKYEFKDNMPIRNSIRKLNGKIVVTILQTPDERARLVTLAKNEQRSVSSMAAVIIDKATKVKEERRG